MVPVKINRKQYYRGPATVQPLKILLNLMRCPTQVAHPMLYLIYDPLCWTVPTFMQATLPA